MRVTVRLLNWSKYNPRNDRKKHTWFRVQNTIYNSPDLFRLTAAEKWGWICLLSIASQHSVDTIEIDTDWLCHEAGLTARDFQGMTQKLTGICLEVVTPIGNRSVSCGSPTDGRTDGRTYSSEHNGTVSHKPKRNAESRFVFSEFWDRYPRKVERTTAEKRFAQVVQTQEDYEALLRATEHYAAYCKKNAIREAGIKHASTFLENRESKPFVQPWRDWVTRGSTDEPGKPSLVQLILDGGG